MKGIGFTFTCTFTFALAACADARDLFRPYVPNRQEMYQVQILPWPGAVMDVGLVLGCPAEADGTLSPCEQCRVDAAVKAYESGLVRNLLFSGGAAHSPHVEADVMADAAIAKGVPAERVVRERRALTTWQNLRFSLAEMKRRGFRTALVISTADHLPRARRIARFWGLDDSRAGYLACDVDLREGGQPPTNTNG